MACHQQNTGNRPYHPQLHCAWFPFGVLDARKLFFTSCLTKKPHSTPQSAKNILGILITRGVPVASSHRFYPAYLTLRDTGMLPCFQMTTLLVFVSLLVWHQASFVLSWKPQILLWSRAKTRIHTVCSGVMPSTASFNPHSYSPLIKVWANQAF
jgi:hypothetical protein